MKAPGRRVTFPFVLDYELVNSRGHSLRADASAPAMAVVIRAGQCRWVGRLRHGNADTQGSLTSPAVPGRTMSTGCVVRDVEEVVQISDQRVAKLYRRQASAFLRTDRCRLCLRS